jgi:hypothetical protein
LIFRRKYIATIEVQERQTSPTYTITIEVKDLSKYLEDIRKEYFNVTLKFAIKV